jgi:predicted GNAT family acetyltransferase
MPGETSHPLDYPIWTALTTRQMPLAEISGPARRYPATIAPFAAVADETPASWAALHALMGPDQPAVMFTPDPVAPPAALFDVVMAATGEQMIGTPAQTATDTPLVTLGAADVPEMMELVELTKPGPFALRTHELGHFLGVKIEGRLVAMTGERMAPGNHTEMTAVCVHPEFRGRGYAQSLLAAVSRQILARGEIPFLHVFSENHSAIALYKRQGMTIRRRLHVTVLGRAGDNLREKMPH